MAVDLAHLPALRICVRLCLDSRRAGERFEHLLFTATFCREHLQQGPLNGA